MLVQGCPRGQYCLSTLCKDRGLGSSRVRTGVLRWLACGGGGQRSRLSRETRRTPQTAFSRLLRPDPRDQVGPDAVSPDRAGRARARQAAQMRVRSDPTLLRSAAPGIPVTTSPEQPSDDGASELVGAAVCYSEDPPRGSSSTSGSASGFLSTITNLSVR
jgi:hypothetical protein